jgi:hypothetical protein
MNSLRVTDKMVEVVEAERRMNLLQVISSSDQTSTKCFSLLLSIFLSVWLASVQVMIFWTQIRMVLKWIFGTTLPITTTPHTYLFHYYEFHAWLMRSVCTTAQLQVTDIHLYATTSNTCYLTYRHQTSTLNLSEEVEWKCCFNMLKRCPK